MMSPHCSKQMKSLQRRAIRCTRSSLICPAMLSLLATVGAHRPCLLGAAEVAEELARCNRAKRLRVFEADERRPMRSAEGVTMVAEDAMIVVRAQAIGVMIDAMSERAACPCERGLA